MDYISTRGDAPAVGFEEALLTGLAPDGGLYVPRSWPSFSAEAIAAMKGQSFDEVAAQVLAPFVGDALDMATLRALTKAAYAGFSDPRVAPLTGLSDDDYVMELYHGPTLAFKDVAMQLLGQLFGHVLEKRDERVTIIGATSGDTGAAAIEAFRGQDRVDVFIFHPEGRVSEVQRRIMTSVQDANVFNIAVEGDFDDCQRIVKSLFADRPLAEKLSLSGVNSINWVRLAVQIVYYFTTHAALSTSKDDAFSYVVPTGNFGDVFAGYAAKRMGLPVDKLCVAVNDNDILDRTMRTGRYERRGVVKTTSPSMDIQVASNFERLVFEASGRDSDLVKAFINGVDSADGAALPAPVLDEIRKDFISARVDEGEANEAMDYYWRKYTQLIDPHTAVGLASMEKARKQGALKGTVVTLSTAHPAKFPEAVEAASGQTPTLPAHFADLYQREEKCQKAPNSVDAIKEILLSHARAGS